MSTGKPGHGKNVKDERKSKDEQTQQQQQQQSPLPTSRQSITRHHNQTDSMEVDDSKPAPQPHQTKAIHPGDIAQPRQVIAVSASRGPAAFFNLARKFLVTDEMCDLSALEGAIVSAVDAAHLLERSKLANIVQVRTSYVTVEPKRRKQQQSGSSGNPSEEERHHDAGSSSTKKATPTTSNAPQQLPASSPAVGEKRSASSSGRELRRARIVITVKRTESYKEWLKENPLQAIIAGDRDDDDGEVQSDSIAPLRPAD